MPEMMRPWRRLFTAGAVVVAVMSVSTRSEGQGQLVCPCSFVEKAFVGNFMDGNGLYDDCKQPQGSAGHFLCYGYVQGVADVMMAGNRVNGMAACIPGPASQMRITDDQIIDVVTRFLASHPAMRASAASGLVTAALEEAFPCK